MNPTIQKAFDIARAEADFNSHVLGVVFSRDEVVRLLGSLDGWGFTADERIVDRSRRELLALWGR